MKRYGDSHRRAGRPAILRRHSIVASLFAMAVSLLMGCGGSHSGQPSAQSRDDADTVNLYIWANYIAPETLASFEKLTGLKVRVSIFETNETLESKMLTGNSGFDVVVPTAPFFQRQIRGGAYMPLDKKQLPNLVNMDPAIMARVALNDPGNVYGVVYAWGTYGLGYNRKMLADLLPGVPVNSWRLVFDPVYAAKLAPCGINFLDAPAGIVRLMLKYLGRDPNAPSPQDFADAESALLKVRPYIRNIDSSIGSQALANGDICIALEYNGPTFQARNRAREANNGVLIDYAIPEEGSLLWFDMLAIPRDAPHARNAHLFINHLMNPQVIAQNSKFIGSANANLAATPLLDPTLVADGTVYPSAAVMQRLFVETEDPPEQARVITRLWQKFKTGE